MKHHTMTELYLITGFLGSGKTTLLSNLLNELGENRSIAVIQNEYAPTGIDGKILKQANDNFKLIEINNGSVFCVCQLSNFEKTTNKLIEEYQPEIIFLEASGLADPISIAEVIETESLKNKLSLSGIITLVDLPNFERSLQMMPRFKHQIMIADKVIANKKDLFDGDDSLIKSKIEAINPFADVFFCQHAKLDWDEVCTIKNENTRSYEQYKGIEAASRPDWACSVLRTHESVDEEKLHAFLEKIIPFSPRTKGFIKLKSGKTVAIQSTFDQIEIKEIENYNGRGELIVFSPKLSSIEIRKIFNESIL